MDRFFGTVSSYPIRYGGEALFIFYVFKEYKSFNNENMVCVKGESFTGSAKATPT